MLGPLGTPELLIIGAIVLLIFGVGRLSGLGRDLGTSIKEFRKAVKDEDKDKPDSTAQSTTQPPQATSQPQYVPPAPPPAPPAQGQQGDQKNIF